MSGKSTLDMIYVPDLSLRVLVMYKFCRQITPKHDTDYPQISKRVNQNVRNDSRILKCTGKSFDVFPSL